MLQEKFYSSYKLYIERLTLLLKKSIPIIASSVCLMLMNITDTITVTKFGTPALTALTVASLISITIFMASAAFIFPIANLISLNPIDSRKYLKATLAMLLIATPLITSISWLSSNYIGKILLPLPARDLFCLYFKWSSFKLIPFVLFVYIRAIIYTFDYPIKITDYMFFAFIANGILNLFAYFFTKNPHDIILFIAISNTILLYSLTYFLNKKLPKNHRISNLLLQTKWEPKIAKTIFKTCIPSMLISFFEFFFFFIIGAIIAKELYYQLGAYRVVVQIEELFILIFYSLSTIISIEHSKNIYNHINTIFTDSILFIICALLLSIFLYFIYPFIISIYHLDSTNNISNLKALAVILLLSESLMLLATSFLRALTKNELILKIILSVNWLLSAPLVIFFKITNISEYIELLIFNYILIGVISFLFYKNKQSHHPNSFLTGI